MPKHEEWLQFAEDDLKAASRRMLSPKEIVLGPALYHTQQCAEKALKAYLVYKQQPLRRIHDLVELLTYAQSLIQSLSCSCKTQQT
jgi:HEPN domain-containing protein